MVRKAPTIEIFEGVDINKSDLESIESDVFTVDEWFNENKQTLK